jgi:hypothetical protein
MMGLATDRISVSDFCARSTRFPVSANLVICEQHLPDNTPTVGFAHPTSTKQAVDSPDFSRQLVHSQAIKPDQIRAGLTFFSGGMMPTPSSAGKQRSANAPHPKEGPRTVAARPGRPRAKPSSQGRSDGPHSQATQAPIRHLALLSTLALAACATSSPPA